MFPISMHTAQPVAADRRNRSELAAACHRLGRSLARAVDAAHNHVPWTSHPDRTNRTIEEFLTHGPSRQKHRALKTVLFTDIVSVHRLRGSDGRRTMERAAATVR